MAATELTAEVKRDLHLMQLRHVLDPKRFYRKGASLDKQSRFFQIGTIVDSPLDPFNRLSKRERKRHVVDELLADNENRKYYKKKFTELQQRQMRIASQGYRGIKKQRFSSWDKMGKQNKQQ
jgi:hypothetical protein